MVCPGDPRCWWLETTPRGPLIGYSSTILFGKLDVAEQRGTGRNPSLRSSLSKDLAYKRSSSTRSILATSTFTSTWRPDGSIGIPSGSTAPRTMKGLRVRPSRISSGTEIARLVRPQDLIGPTARLPSAGHRPSRSELYNCPDGLPGWRPDPPKQLRACDYYIRTRVAFPPIVVSGFQGANYIYGYSNLRFQGGSPVLFSCTSRRVSDKARPINPLNPPKEPPWSNPCPARLALGRSLGPSQRPNRSATYLHHPLMKGQHVPMPSATTAGQPRAATTLSTAGNPPSTTPPLTSTTAACRSCGRVSTIKIPRGANAGDPSYLCATCRKTATAAEAGRQKVSQ